MRVYENAELCPLCQMPLIALSGPTSARVVIIGERPGKEEKQALQPFVGPSGRLLQAELARIGLPFEECLVTNIWRHEPVKKNEAEYEWHVNNAQDAASHAEFVLLLGSEASVPFLGEKVTAITGLWRKRWGQKFMAVPNPAAVLRSTLGEFRLGLEKFKKGIK